jgi:ATP-dependent metalloprotease
MLKQIPPMAGDAATQIHAEPSQHQAIAQAIAARSAGADVAAAAPTGSGAKQGPLYVVVNESRGAMFFRWTKFLLTFGVVTYFSLVFMSFILNFIDNMSVLNKRPGGAVSKSNAAVKAESQTTKFSDVHGCDEAKDELQELVDFLKNPEKFTSLGGKLPKGVLLVGPPGTGKTLLARAVAGEAGVPFFYMSGSEFDEVYVGVGARRVRDLFSAARAKGPAIVFIDELDAIGGRRNSRDAAYVKQTLNQLLTELDGFDQNSGVIILGATNFPELLDKALTRPGRFDRHVVVELPDARGRVAILKHHAKKIKADTEVNYETIASGTPGLSGAELENIVNQAAIRASRVKAETVTMKHFEWAKDKVLMGAERRSMVISPKEKEMTAYHEAGHALVLLFANTPSTRLHKVTILPRGFSLGLTAHLPEMDKYSYTLSDYSTMIQVSLGGKVAEELQFGTDHVTSGVSNVSACLSVLAANRVADLTQDLQKATKIAFNVVAQYGMSQKLGNMDYAENYKNLSSETRSMVEGEVQRILNENYEKVRQLLESKRKELDRLAKALVQYETLDRIEVEKVVRGEALTGRVPMPIGPMTVPLPERSELPTGITTAPGPARPESPEGPHPPPGPTP